MISLRNFALRRGERLLLSNVDLTLHAGYRVGVVGRNGAGKSSLFAAVKGELEADKGDVDLPGKVRIASVAQETPSLPDAAIDFVLSGDTEVHAVLARTLQDAWTTAPRVEGSDATFHAFTGTPDRRIDWIFVRGVQLESITSVTTRWNHRYPSDHFPLVATLRLP